MRAITTYGGTTAGAPNFAYDFCVDRTDPDQRAGLDLRTWDIAYNGSEPVRAQTLERFAKVFATYGFRKEAFYPCYGMAEATLLIAGGAKALQPTLRPLWGDEKGGEDVKTLVSCGRTWGDEELRVVDPDSHQPKPPGEVGEIWLAGSNISSGYWNQTDENARIFGASLAGENDGRFMRTGDLGLVADGELYVTGRIKDVMIIRGRNHYPQDVEATVQAAHPALRTDCGAAFLIETDAKQALFVVNEVERSVLRDVPVREIAGAVRASVSLAHGLHVTGVVLLKTAGVPKTSSGKIQRRLTRARYMSGELRIVGEDLHGRRFWEEGQPPLRETTRAGMDVPA